MFGDDFVHLSEILDGDFLLENVFKEVGVSLEVDAVLLLELVDHDHLLSVVLILTH